MNIDRQAKTYIDQLKATRQRLIEDRADPTDIAYISGGIDHLGVFIANLQQAGHEEPHTKDFHGCT